MSGNRTTAKLKFLAESSDAAFFSRIKGFFIIIHAEKILEAMKWLIRDEAAVLHAFTCSSCSVELVCDENTMATECVYCGNPTMIPKRFDGMLKPDYV